MEAIKDQEVIKKSCLAFGVYETARKLSDDKQRLKVLIKYLIASEILEPAFLIANHFFAKDDISEFGDAFTGIDSGLSRRDVERLFFE